MNTRQINIEQFSEQIMQPIDWIPRRISDQTIFGQLCRGSSNFQRSLVLPYIEQPIPKPSFQPVFRPKQKKPRGKKACDYRKNICGYITKKIIRQYISPTYQTRVENLCFKNGCDYQDSKKYFLGKIQRVTGPSHVPQLFEASTHEQKAIKAAFKQFFIWFTKQRYLRYLILQGKMQQKQAYIEYKNTVLMSLVNPSPNQIRQGEIQDQSPKESEQSY